VTRPRCTSLLVALSALAVLAGPLSSTPAEARGARNRKSRRTRKQIRSAAQQGQQQRSRGRVSNPMAEGIKLMAAGASLWSASITGWYLPACKAAIDINQTITRSWLQVIAGKKTPAAHLREIGKKTVSGLRYDRLVDAQGKKLFGSATFAGEKVLVENELFKLSYIPAVQAKGAGSEGRTSKGRASKGRASKARPAVFHVGGFLPYGDKVFRFLPEKNLFKPLIERGMDVYAFELKPGVARKQARLGTFTLEKLIDTIDGFSDVAFKHNRKRKMVIEGYCGLGMPTISYLAAKPKQANSKFSVAAAMVAPVDGRACTAIGAVTKATPDSAKAYNQCMAKLLGGVVPGAAIGATFDLASAENTQSPPFAKTPMGRFCAGWQAGGWDKVKRVADLDKRQRQTLAGAYWISPAGAASAPMPLDLANFASRLWSEGVVDGKIPATYKGKQLSLKTIRDKTSIRMIGFYGGKDQIVPDTTAAPLKKALGKRYRHVVDPDAGHIAFVMSSRPWRTEQNPAAIICQEYAASQRKPRAKRR
jgi:pimeloyl-ACP methyl ester carboxylesterase